MTEENLKKMSPQKREAYLKKKKQVERNRKILKCFICVILVSVVMLILSLTVLFKVDTIKIQGDCKYEDSQIINASGENKGSNLILCNKDKMSDGIKKNLPYVSNVTVEKKFPSTLIINITSTKPFMSLETMNGNALIDNKGKVLEFVKKESIPKGVAKLETDASLTATVGENLFDLNLKSDAADKQKSRAQMVQSVVKAINDSGIKDITQIRVESSAEIYVVYQNRLTLNLGSANDLTYKLKSAVEIIKKENKIDPDGNAEIFLSDPGNAYVSPEKSSQ